MALAHRLVGFRPDHEPRPIEPRTARPVERPLRLLLLATDAACVGAVWIGVAAPEWSADRLLVAAIGATTALVWLATHGMYYSPTHDGVHHTRLLYEAALIAAVAANVADARLGVHLGAAALAIGAIAGALALHAGRHAYQSHVAEAQRHGRHLRKAIVVGGDDDAAHVVTTLRARPELGYDVAATVEPHDAPRVVRIAREIGGETVIVVPSSLPASSVARVVRDTTNAGLHVHLVGPTTGIDPRRVEPRSLGRDTSVHIARVSLDGWQASVKRMFDVALGTVLLVLSLPFWVAAAVAIRVGDHGPVLFRQERIGRGGRPFTMFKFRTMVVDAEAQLAALTAGNDRTGPLFKLADDPRVTRIGKLLRATSIDELPQLLNVLAGQMSLVGPRPALAQEVEHFDDELCCRDLVLPGITGLWQIEGRDDPDFSVYEETDVFYVENWSVGLDLVILSRTGAALARRVWSRAVPGRSHVAVLD
jgi:exopolysaccharide biosynthesis polyprenyl glycosylphosphotransferase